MTQHEHDLRRQELEARYRAALAILEAGHRAQVEELERLWQAEREAELQPEAPAPVPEPVRRWGLSLLDECRDALDRLPEEFDKDDLLRVLSFSPHRSSLQGAPATRMGGTDRRQFRRDQPEGERLPSTAAGERLRDATVGSEALPERSRNAEECSTSAAERSTSAAECSAALPVRFSALLERSAASRERSSALHERSVSRSNRRRTRAERMKEMAPLGIAALEITREGPQPIRCHLTQQAATPLGAPASRRPSCPLASRRSGKGIIRCQNTDLLDFMDTFAHRVRSCTLSERMSKSR
jgi:hypothetical protein